MGGYRRGRRLAAAVVAATLAIGCGGGGDDGDEVAAEQAEPTTTTAEAATTTPTEPRETSTTTTEPVDPEDFVGRDIAVALDDLRESGYDVDQHEVIDETVPAGQILDVEEQTGSSVVVTVAARPVTRFLEAIRPVDADTDVDGPTFNISGTTYTHGISSDGCTGDGAFFEYDLGRDFRRLQATAGLLDTDPSDTRIRLEILLDGEIVDTQDLGLGDTAAIDLDITGKLRVRFHFTVIAGRRGCSAIGFGDARLLGVPSEVPAETGT